MAFTSHFAAEDEENSDGTLCVRRISRALETWCRATGSTTQQWARRRVESDWGGAADRLAILR
jgi:hypothetical protein